MNIRLIVPVILLMMGMQYASGENGYDLWLRYNRIGNQRLIQEYVSHNRNIVSIGSDNPTIKVACDELCHALSGLTGVMPSVDATVDDGTVILCTGETLPKGIESRLDLDGTGEDGFVITSSTLDNKQVTLIVGESAVGTLYGTFRYIGLMQTGGSLENLGIRDAPRLRHRMLNHWDNLNGTIERGYAGYSLWNWERLPQDCDPRYIDYARANASIGINGVVVNNVNASARSLRHVELVRLSGLADAWRPYGIKVYLTAKFSAPIEIGGLSTADPLSPEVQAWWKRKVDEIYEIIPDFGGFLVKANSEGQPGPQDYGRTHADGANMLGDALAPHGGVVFWRAFVYKNDRHNDRVKGGYEEFKPLDGKFRDNVMVQPKNGPIDFQPREPFHPLIGEMPRTALSVEFQITQENLGHAGHLVYLGKLYEEVLQSQIDGQGTTVADCLMAYKILHGHSALAGVPNIGSEINWTGHPFGQANWYAFGRLAWNPKASSEEIAQEWAKKTFTQDEEAVDKIVGMMMLSREAVVNYTMPLGLNHIMNYATHNGPEPWHDDPVWTAFDYHKVTKDSIGVNRTRSGTGAVLQYKKPIAERWDNLKTCPDEYLLWFHRLPWNYKMRSGRTLWLEMVDKYHQGVNQVRMMKDCWGSLSPYIDAARHHRVSKLLDVQEDEAKWWRDGCLLFFQQYSGLEIPKEYEQPEHSLHYYKSIPFPYDWKGYFKE